jgi:alkaline phosphatase
MEMTRQALNILKKNSNGYVLMVEGGRIDHGHHETRARRALDETVSFNEAVEFARSQVNEEDTLILVTADHSHVLTVGGYPVSSIEFINDLINKVNFHRGEEIVFYHILPLRIPME